MKEKPLVVCLTNTVAANFTANVLLAIGAKPAMVEEASEATELVSVADAVLVNVGTLTPPQADVMRAAVYACHTGPVPTCRTGPVPPDEGSVPTCRTGPVPTCRTGPVPTHLVPTPTPLGPVPRPIRGTVPWVLDPVACQTLSYRRAFVYELLNYKPTVLRGNRSEIDFLLGPVPNQTANQTVGTGPRPVEGTVPSAMGSVPDLLGSVPSLATGAEDIVRRGRKVVARVTGGVPMLQRVTATGCAQGAICAAFLGRGQSPEEALLSASRLMKRAGERAYRRTQQVGSFQMALLDALSEISSAD